MPHLRSCHSLCAAAGLALTALLGVGTAQARDMAAQGLSSGRYEAAPSYAPPPPPRYAPPPAIRSEYRAPRDRDDYNEDYRRGDHHHHHHHRDRDRDRNQEGGYRGSYSSDGGIPARR